MMQLEKSENSDRLEVGIHIMALHHDTWEKINWIEQYPMCWIFQTCNYLLTSKRSFKNTKLLLGSGKYE